MEQITAIVCPLGALLLSLGRRRWVVVAALVVGLLCLAGNASLIVILPGPAGAAAMP